MPSRTSSADAVSAPKLQLPSQVSPPDFALSETPPHGVAGVEVVALPVLPGEDGTAPLLGPGAADLADLLDLDLVGVLEFANATGRAGEVTSLPVPQGSAANADLGLLLLVGVGAQRGQDFRRAGAALARATRDRASVATTIPAIAPDEALTPFVVGTMLGSFGFQWRSGPPEHQPVGQGVPPAPPPTPHPPRAPRAPAGAPGGRP